MKEANTNLTKQLKLNSKTSFIPYIDTMLQNQLCFFTQQINWLLQGDYFSICQKCGYDVESCSGRVNPCVLRVPAFARRVREPVLLCVRVRGGRRLRNSSCG